MNIKNTSDLNIVNNIYRTVEFREVNFFVTDKMRGRERAPPFGREKNARVASLFEFINASMCVCVCVCIP